MIHDSTFYIQYLNVIKLISLAVFIYDDACLGYSRANWAGWVPLLGGQLSCAWCFSWGLLVFSPLLLRSFFCFVFLCCYCLCRFFFRVGLVGEGVGRVEAFGSLRFQDMTPTSTNSKVGSVNRAATNSTRGRLNVV